jgi:YggT family protein
VNSTIATIFVDFLYLLIAAIVVRALLSWFPLSPRNRFVEFVARITDPLIQPVRRVVPPLGMLDLSSMIVIVVLYVMIYVVRSTAAA